MDVNIHGGVLVSTGETEAGVARWGPTRPQHGGLKVNANDNYALAA